MPPKAENQQEHPNRDAPQRAAGHAAGGVSTAAQVEERLHEFAQATKHRPAGKLEVANAALLTSPTRPYPYR